MNKIMNDTGSLVEAIGAPGSMERLRVERPALIARLDRLYNSSYDCYGHAVDRAIELIRENGIRSELETANLLRLSRYGEEPSGSVTKLVLAL